MWSFKHVREIVSLTLSLRLFRFWHIKPLNGLITIGSPLCMRLEKLMKTVIIYHNPRCSKSRQALEILKSHHIEPTIVEYLKTPLNLEQLRELRSFFDLKDFVRTNESAFTQFQLNLDDEMSVLEAMTNEPILMQRPIVTSSGKAIIAREPVKLLEWMETL